MSDKRQALVLSGGNVKGAYQAGAINALLNHTFADGSRFQPDAIFGVSVGALNGGFLADRAGRAAKDGKAPDWPAIGAELVAFWRDRITGFKAIGKKRNTFKLVVQIVGGKFNGLTKMDGAAALARELISVAHLEASPVYYACGVTNMRTGDYFSADVQTYGDDFLDYIIASTREPVNMPIMWVNGEPLVDGGLRNIAPLKPAVKNGADQLAVIAMKPDRLTVIESRKTFGNMLKLLKRTLGTLTSEIVNSDLEMLSEINAACRAEIAAGGQRLTAGKRVIEFIQVRPAQKLDINVTQFTSADISNLIRQGEEEAREQLKRGWLEVL